MKHLPTASHRKPSWTSVRPGASQALREFSAVLVAVLVGASLLLVCGPLWSGTPDPELIKDIAIAGEGSRPTLLEVMDGYVLFAADDGVHGLELWRTDGTALGTGLVKDIFPGPTSSLIVFSFQQQQWAKVGNKLVFAANDGVHARELWITDGTDAGTQLLKDINPGDAVFSWSNPEWFEVASGTLFFSAESANDRELWKTDLTEAGTVRVKDIRVGGDSNPYYLEAFNGDVYFTANGGIGNQLWRSDGSELGTEIVALGSTGTSQSELTAAGPLLFFTTIDADGSELWTYDPVGDTAAQVKDINVGAVGSNPRDLTVLGNKVYFTANDPSSGYELWESDGTALGTTLVANLSPGSDSGSPKNLTAFGSDLLFSASQGFLDAALYLHSPSGPTTTLLEDFLDSSPTALEVIGKAGGLALVSATDAAGGKELWSTDGTAAGTILVKDIDPGIASSDPGTGLTLSGELIFPATDSHGEELWKTDGTESGTDKITDIHTGNLGSISRTDCPDPGMSDPSCDNPFDRVAAIGETLFFVAETETSGSEVWKTDGSELGTALVKDIVSGAGGSNPNYLTSLGDTVLFTASQFLDNELWRTDGTEAGTFRVKNINEAGSSEPRDFLTVGSVAFFSAYHSDSGRELWRSDGTEEGTYLVKDMLPGTDSSSPSHLASYQGSLVFSAAYDVESENEPWISDGTEAGTMLLLDIHPTSGSSPHSFVELAGELYFRASEPVSGAELWKTDGTTVGTVLAADFCAGACGTDATPKGIFNGELFVAHEANTPDRGGSEGIHLSKLDTLGNVSFVTELCLHECAEDRQFAINDQGIFFVYLRDSESTEGELWTSDGTSAGTLQLIDIHPTQGSHPRMMTPLGRQLFFSAEDGTNGRELWVTDGTLDGICQSHLNLGGRSMGQAASKSATKTISSSGIVGDGAVVQLNAEESVRLGSGFRVEAGATVNISSATVCP